MIKPATNYAEITGDGDIDEKLLEIEVLINILKFRVTQVEGHIAEMKSIIAEVDMEFDFEE